jgi:16S rRNA G527 N7-methylase RsmG
MAPSFDLLPYLGNSIRSIAEVGPGNGGLGLSLAVLLPDHSVHLIDRRRKVCDFLALAAARFEITNCKVHEASVANYRAEPRSFDVVTARAVASPDVLLVELPKIVATDGLLALFKTEAPVLARPELQLVTHVPTRVPGLWLDLFNVAQQDV